MTATKGEAALEQLIEGNQRYLIKTSSHPHRSAERRRAVSAGQRPWAVIIGCSDSRVPPELIFDCGLGDLFVIRLAGNILDEAVLGSVEYAVEHLAVKLVMVLGHSRCGAVTAAVEAGGAAVKAVAVKANASAESVDHISVIIKALQPAAAEAATQAGDLIEQTARCHVRRTVVQLTGAKPSLEKLVRTGEVKIVGAYYDLDSGLVEIIR